MCHGSAGIVLFLLSRKNLFRSTFPKLNIFPTADEFEEGVFDGEAGAHGREDMKMTSRGQLESYRQGRYVAAWVMPFLTVSAEVPCVSHPVIKRQKQLQGGNYLL